MALGEALRSSSDPSKLGSQLTDAIYNFYDRRIPQLHRVFYLGTFVISWRKHEPSYAPLR
jgi:hypothetical protein